MATAQRPSMIIWLAAALLLLAGAAWLYAARAVPIHQRIQAAVAAHDVAQLRSLRAEVAALPAGPARDEMIASLEAALGADANVAPQPVEARVPDLTVGRPPRP